MTDEVSSDRTSLDASRWVTLAHIRRAQGRKGEVLADLLTDFPEKFAERRHLWLLAPKREPWQVELVDHWLHKGGIVLHFAGVDSITAAETLRDVEVVIPREERAALGEDEFYVGDLIGSSLVDAAVSPARLVGVVEDVDRASGPVALLVVQVEGAKEPALIPLVKAWLDNFDAAAKRLTMRLPEGLADINS